VTPASPSSVCDTIRPESSYDDQSRATEVRKCEWMSASAEVVPNAIVPSESSTVSNSAASPAAVEPLALSSQSSGSCPPT
jgi:hypothetical protein